MRVNIVDVEGGAGASGRGLEPRDRTNLAARTGAGYQLLCILTMILMSSTLVQAAGDDSALRWQSLSSVDGREKWHLIYSEESVWHFVAIERASGRLQTQREHLVFPSKEQALAYRQSAVPAETDDKADWFPQETLFDSASEGQWLTELAGEHIWTATQTWNESWEERFALWMQNETDATYFERHGVATDCADVAYALRWIFARIHGLPAGNRLSGSGQLFTNESMRASGGACRRRRTGPKIVAFERLSLTC